MLKKRIIPVLQLTNESLVKTKKFKVKRYLGDPLNAIRIFNEKFVNELVIVDISVSENNDAINFEHLNEIASECFIPLAYGGGVRTIDDARKILNLGFEKIIINSSFIKNPTFITTLAKYIGSQSSVVSIDYKYNYFNKPFVYSKHLTRNSIKCPLKLAISAEKLGAGEVFINCVSNDGRRNGIDLEFIKSVHAKLTIPLMPCGGVGCYEHIHDVINSGINACCAGSYFSLSGYNSAVLITYLSDKQLSTLNSL